MATHVPETPARLLLPVDRGRVVIADLLLFCIVTNTWVERERVEAWAQATRVSFPWMGGRQGGILLP